MLLHPHCPVVRGCTQQGGESQVLWAKRKNVPSHVWLCDPIDYNQPGSPVLGILQARILKWVVISSSRGSSWPRDRTWVSCVSCIAGRFLTCWAMREALKTDWQKTNQGPLVEFYFVTEIPHYRISKGICLVKKSCQNFKFLMYNRKVR